MEKNPAPTKHEKREDDPPIIRERGRFVHINGKEEEEARHNLHKSESF